MFSVSRFTVDEVGASKEALMHVELMNVRLNELLGTNEVLKENIRVSTRVSVTHFHSDDYIIFLLVG